LIIDLLSLAIRHARASEDADAATARADDAGDYVLPRFRHISILRFHERRRVVYRTCLGFTQVISSNMT